MAVVRCTDCQSPLEIDAVHIGSAVQCGACGAEFTAREDPAADPAGRSDWAVDRPPRDWGDDPERPRPGSRRYQDDLPDEEYAEAKLATPAVGIIVTGSLGVVCGLLIGFCGVASMLMAQAGGQANPQARGPDDAAVVFGIILYGGWGLVAVVLSMLMISGGLRMRRLSGYGLALTGAIVAMIPCLSPCFILGLPFGIIAIIALNDPEVAAAFADRRRRS